MQEPEDPAEEAEDAEVKEDLERYFRLIVATEQTWWDFWLIGGMCIAGGVGVFAFSGETWALAASIVLFAAVFLRTARIINRLDGELSYLHRKWVRRGRFFITDGRTAEALPHRSD